MKKGLLILIALCIIAIIVIIAILINLSNNKTKTNNNKTQNGLNTNEENNNITNTETEIEKEPEEMYLNKEIHKEDKTMVFFSVERNIKNYITYLRVNNQNAINSLSNGIPVFNANGLSSKTIIIIKELYSVDNDNGTTFFVKLDLSNNGEYTIKFIEDFINGTFSISSMTSEEYNTSISGKSNMDYTKHVEIQKNEYNTIQYTNMSNSEVAERYLRSYIQKARYSPEEAYNTLDEVYRNTRFGSLENFKKYLEEKAEELESLDPLSVKDASEFATVDEYTKYVNSLKKTGLTKFDKYTDGDIEYLVCLDTYGNYYIFKISHVMDYKLMLDSYTLNTPRFLEEYQKSNEQEKVELTINKVFEALNNKDFKYIYGKLDEDFKNANFSNYSDFVQKMQNNFFERNTVEFDEYDETDGVHEYTLIITDANNIDKRELNLKIFITLGDNTDYTLKFE